MKAKTVKLKDTEKLKAWLDEVQAKSKVRTITVWNIEEMCETVFNRIGIAKKAMEGVNFEADYNAQTFPSAYRYTPGSTHIEAIYKRGEWIITDIYRYECQRPGNAFRVNLTDTAKEAIIIGVQRFGW